jgi:hemolysin activation/secretion protein
LGRGAGSPDRHGSGTARQARLLAFLSGVAIPASALAQAVPDPPRPPTREEVRRDAPSRAERRGPGLAVEGGIERAPCALAGEAFRDIRFTLAAVEFRGLKGLGADALRPAWEPFAGGEQPIAAVCEIRDRAATILRDAGYIAVVEIPEQRIADGVVRFDVLTARLVSIRVRGDAGRAERTIARYLERLTGQEAFNRYHAERYLLLAGEMPGYDVRLTLRSAGGAPGEVVGEVALTRTLAEFEVNVQNYGSAELGRWGGMARARLYDLTGLGDRTTLAFFTTADLDEQQTVQVGHDFRVGGEGLTLAGVFTYAWAKPSLDDPALRVRARTLLATVEAGYPFILTQSKALRGSLGLDMVNQRVGLNGLPLSRDRLRVAFARLAFDGADRASLGARAGYSGAEPRWRLGGSLELRQGLGILGATDPCGPAPTPCTAPGAVPPSRLEADPTATVMRFEATGEYRPLPRLAFALGARAQWAPKPLPSFEEFSAGNYSVGRGYDPGTLLGDRGAGFQAELRYGTLMPAGPKKVALQPYLFLDAAWVDNKDRLFTAGRQSLSSAGGGLRAAFGDKATLDVVLAVPLERAGLQTGRGDPRLLVSLTAGLWPWRSR